MLSFISSRFSVPNLYFLSFFLFDFFSVVLRVCVSHF